MQSPTKILLAASNSLHVTSNNRSKRDRDGMYCPKLYKRKCPICRA